MSTTLLEHRQRRKATAAKSLDEARREYAALLRLDNHTAADCVRLDELQAVLHLTDDDVDRDKQAVKAACDAEKRLLSDADRQKFLDDVSRTGAAANAEKAERDKRVKELERIRNNAIRCQADADSRDENDRETIERLRKSNPRAFGSVPATVTHDSSPINLGPRPIESLGGATPINTPREDYKLVASNAEQAKGGDFVGNMRR